MLTLNIYHRINVACSRAKHGFYIIGNSSLMQTVGMWYSIVNLLSRKGKIGSSFHACCSRHTKSTYEIRQPDDFSKVPICDVMCGGILPCGHICRDKCHSRDLHHRKLCAYPCPKRHEDCGHACGKLCGEPCGDCTEESVSVVLTCGHSYEMTCKEEKNGNAPVCDTKIKTLRLECGHDLERLCGMEGVPSVCQQQCSTALDCGHGCSGICSDCQIRGTHAKCNGQCGRVGDCGHPCPLPCHSGNCPPCEVVCEAVCAHTKYKHKCSSVSEPCTMACSNIAGCNALCCLPCTTFASNNPCPRILKCGHLCPSLEDERCPDICAQCVTGDFPEYVQVCLPCTHAVDLKTLDRHLEATNFLNITDTGQVGSPKPLALQDALDLSGCPRCGGPVDEVRRYSSISKLRQISKALDELYVMFGQKMNSFMMRTFHARGDLRDEQKSFAQRLISGPLGGKNNENLVKMRGSRTMELQTSIITFRGKKVIPLSINQY